MNITVTSAKLSGNLRAIPSKSYMHRALICASLAEKPTSLYCPETNRDIEATAACLRALGAEIAAENGWYRVTPMDRSRPVTERAVLDCGESGSTLRFLLPVAAALGRKTAFEGHGRLPQRPLSPLYERMQERGAVLSPAGRFPLTVDGQLLPGDYRLDGGVSSQYFTGLLLALPLLSAPSRIFIEGALESAPYVDLTMGVLKTFGVTPVWEGNCMAVTPQPSPFRSPGELTVEGDWSNAAFWLVAGALNGEIRLTGLQNDSRQGDRAILPVLREMGANLSVDQDGVTVSRSALHGVTVNATDIPDLVPILAVAAAAAEGETVITGASRLRLKESDRIRSVRDMLCALGAVCEETSDGLRIRGGKLQSGTVDSCNDHRIAMSAAVAACACKGEVTVLGAESAEKSYPGFFRDLRTLGGILCERNG